MRPVGSRPSTGASRFARKPRVPLRSGAICEIDAEIDGELLGVGDGARARVPRGHRDPVDVVGAERIDGDGRHKRGVDAA